MKNKIVMVFIMLILACSPYITTGESLTFADGQAGENYIIYDENGEVICEKSAIEIGDGFITPDFYEYEIIHIENHKGYAKLVRKLKEPKIEGKKDLSKDKMAQRGQLEKKICLYMTHNDESYKPSDGYDSIYGAGGIHDVAKQFKNELAEKGINVVLDETLHVPHNSSAYSRSAVTANNLLSSHRPDAMFDIHRDGVSKSYYYVTNDGKGYSKIRIVVGKSNPNFDENYEFAQSIFALGNKLYPFLFSDIYLGKGHYNQALQPTDLLFEMGTYLIEKDYVYKSLPLLADVVDTALYASETDEDGNIKIDEDVVKPDDTVTVKPPVNTNKTDNDNQRIESSKNGWKAPMIISIAIISGLIIFGIILAKRNNKEK